MITVRAFLVVAALSVLAGCPKNVGQEAHSGKDARAKGAVKVKIEDNQGSIKGVVTYPGGDRVDWKVFEIKQKGDVTVSLKWKPPRPGLDLSFNVLDETMAPLPEGKAKPSKGSKKTKKSITLNNVDPGKYYVQIYASERGDAGAYTLNVEWAEHPPDDGGGGGAQADEIPNPPRLAAVPEPAPATAAGGTGTPPAGTGTPPAGTGTPPTGTDPTGGTGTKPVKPVKASITEMTMSGSDLLVILDKGKGGGLDSKWTGVILRGSSGDKQLTKSDADLLIIRVTEDEATAKVLKLSIDQIGENKRVLLKPPPPSE